jgi:anti-sigma factor RsiW
MIARPIGDDDVHAYVDGALDPARRAEVETWLAENREAAMRAAFYARTNELLHQRYDHVLAEPVPGAMSRPPSRWRTMIAPRSAAIAASWLIVGLGGGWFAHQALTPPRVVERVVMAPPQMPQLAAIAHTAYASEVRHPVEVGADEEEHLVRWLTNRMGKPVKAPKLEPLGYRLMGGRLLPGAEGGVACQFMYENASGQRLTLYIRTPNPDQAETAFRFATEKNGLGVFYWIDRNLAYAISASLPKEDLRKLARAVYDQLNV